ncbi:MAG: hypothetical protein DU429_02500 [Candidatus Tokpelaia sp.]|nr:MAG: hypothetical protein DU430_05250 [Candidatus Tokpelaia sp.]KAA6207352.1 MAG: hypothetical protein DU429_02500 [Candidatus Tokpelaia sp.]
MTVSHSLNQKLADEVWNHPKFQESMEAVRLAWLKYSIGRNSAKEEKEALNPTKLMQSAAILACSEHQEHRHAAFNIATQTYELFGAETLPLEQALRVVLARLKNFPSFETRTDVQEAESSLPLSLAIEEEKTKADNKIVVNDKAFFLTNFQYQLWDNLTAGKNTALTAPTSAGKSFILQLYLAHIFTQDEAKIVIYLVPTRALISQVSRDIEFHFSKFQKEQPKIITMALTTEESLPERAIYVLTQERAQLALSANNAFTADIIIVDEAHTISEGSRGVLLYGVVADLLARSPSAQILFAGPGIKNLDVFKNTFNLQEMTELPSHEATVGQNFLITQKATGKIFSISTEKAELLEEVELPIESPQSQRKILIQTVLYFGKAQANIIYANGADDAEKYAEALAKDLPDPTSREKRERLEELASFVQEVIHKDYKLVSALKKGIGFHYGGMPSYVREIVEEAFSQGNIQYLCSTSTLLQGINLPAKNIFMMRPKRGKTNPLKSVDFWNLSGRAGRLKREFQGNVYLVDYANWQEKPLEQEKEAVITPAIAETITKYESQLQAEIQGTTSDRKDPLQETCETVFTRLLTDYKGSSLEQTLEQLSIESEAKQRLAESLKIASEQVSLPDSVLKQNPTISPLSQQKLFDYISDEIANHRSEALIPLFPRDSSSYANYCQILQICRQYIMKKTDNSHKYIALLASKWAEGTPIPQIINETITYYTETGQTKSQATIIRDTLKGIEQLARYEAVRLFNCYNSLLTHAFEQHKLTVLLGRISPIPTYLELGACDTTALNLMSLGLSRHTALKITEGLTSNLDLEETIGRLKSFKTEGAELPEFCIREIRRIQEGL